MARRSLSQNIPNLVKGSTVISACTYQSQAGRPSSSFHDDSEDAGEDAVGLHAHHGPAAASQGPVLVGGKRGAELLVGPSSRPTSPAADKCRAEADRCRVISTREVEEATRVLFQRESDTQVSRATVHLQGAPSQPAQSSATAPCMSIAPAVGARPSLVAADATSNTTTTTTTPAGPPCVHRPAASLARLHPKPAVHEEIVRFGMKLANDPKIQSAICESLELRQGLEHVVRTAQGGASGDEVRTAVSSFYGLEGGEQPQSFEAPPGDNLSHSFEVVDVPPTANDTEAADDSMGPCHPSNSFISLGRSILRKDTIVGTGDVSEELLDELLRSDDDEDLITSKMFAQTSDDQIRRYLRNLDLECVICHEYMVDATAVDCGEGHTFCRECISTWLDAHSRCPTCLNPACTTVPMRQLDTMIEKYVRASNLWDEIGSYYRRKTLGHLRWGLKKPSNKSPAVGRQSQSGARAGGGARAAAGAAHSAQQSGEASETEPVGPHWWQSEVLSTAMSVAAMIILVALFRRGVRPGF